MLKSFLLEVTGVELNLKNTFMNGQCFNWKALPNGTHFAGVLYGSYVQVHRPDPEHIHVSHTPNTTHLDFKSLFVKYLNLQIQLSKLTKEWAGNDAYITDLSERLPGTRVLKQDPWQCTISFICSSNNNILRITKLLQSLRQTYGTFICSKDGVQYYAFPTPEALNQRIDASDLRKMGFGYRAQYIAQSVATIMARGGQKYLHELQTKDYPQIKEQLVQLKGVGRKVADCISLFGMGCSQAVPVDTHIFQIAKRLGFAKQSDSKKSLGDALYNDIAKSYVKRFGNYAGWAQQLLFAGDLPQFNKPSLPIEVETTQPQEPTKRSKNTKIKYK